MIEVGHWQRLDEADALGPQPQSFTTGDQDHELGTCRKQVANEARGIHDVFEVVENDQARLGRQEVVQSRRLGRAVALTRSDGLGDRGRHQVEIPNRRQVDKPDVGERIAQFARQFESQPRLARAAGAGECEQSGALCREQTAQLGDCFVAPKQRRARNWWCSSAFTTPFACLDVPFFGRLRQDGPF
jgi:hypothetical protein